MWSSISLYFWSVISLMTNDVEHVFMCLAAVCVSSLEKYLFKSFAYLLIELFVSFVFELYQVLYVFGEPTLIRYMICKYFLPFCRIFSLYWYCSFIHKKLTLKKSNIYFFLLLFMLLLLYLRFHCQTPNLEDLSLFFSKSFMVSVLTYGLLIHFEFFLMFFF